MNVKANFPNEIKEVEHCWIPLRDGTRLAARLWIPADAVTRPVPAIFEFIPYRKRDFTAQRDAKNHRYFAGHGYACVRVDMRGSGDSEGVLLDEYIEQEQLDGVEILEWIADQDWCDGNVGMFGISWGGFNGLQIAARQPPQLKAIVSVASTDDRYADDVHYMGGCLLGDNLSWASTMFAYNSSPPDPELVGEKWDRLWRNRMEQSGLWVVHWLQHQTRDAYWKHGSVCEDFSAIQCPVMAVSGWADGYSNAVFRLLEGLDSPRMGLIGPWSHKYPHMGVPGPAIGFLQECLRWWDYWLKGIETGIQNEPTLRVWMQDYAPPSSAYETREGRWVGEASWPSPNVDPVDWGIGTGSVLSRQPGDGSSGGRGGTVSIQSPLSVGQFSGKWCSYLATPDLPGDQREEDGGSYFWQSVPLAEAVEILGAPLGRLRLRLDQPVGMVALRLSEVAADGKATRVSYGLLNLTHRESHEDPQPLEPEDWYDVEVRLNDCAHRFAEGSSIRFSLSTSLWPLAWPPPRGARLDLDTGVSAFTLPHRTRQLGSDSEITFKPPECAPGLQETVLDLGTSHWKLERDLGSAVSTLEVLKDDGTVRLDAIDLEYGNYALERYVHERDDFASVTGETLWKRRWKRGDWEPSIVARTKMRCTEDQFLIYADLDAYVRDKRVFCKSWEDRISRYLV